MISAAAVSFLRNGIEVVGVKHGYSSLIDFERRRSRWSRAQDYVMIDHPMLSRTRSNGGAS